MVGIAVEGFTESGDSRIAVAQDIIVDLIILDPLGGLEVQSSDAQAAVKICLVGLQSWEDDIRSDGSMLVYIEDREDQAQDVVDEVIEEVLVAFVDLDHGLVRGAESTVRKVEHLKVEGLLRIRLPATLEVVLLDPVLGGELVADDGWGLICAECGDGRISSCWDVVDVHLALGLDVDFVRRKLAWVERWSEHWRGHGHWIE